MEKKKRKSVLHQILAKACRVISAAFIENHLLQVSNYLIVSEKIPSAFQGYKIVQLSDLHSHCFGRGNGRLLQKIDAAQPDLIVMTGDMVSRSDSSHKVFFQLAETLGKRYLCYYVIGNHELDMERNALQVFLAQLTALHIRVMDNEKVEIPRGNSGIQLYGMWFSLKYYKESRLWSAPAPQFGEREMKQAIGKYDSTHYGILLTHNPLCFPTYTQWGADLTFCGHIHGGMIRLPFAGGLLSPERQFFPKYSAGIYERNGKKMLVSRGLGSGTFGIRIFNCPEVVVVTLAHSPAKDRKTGE
jgi:predicted MPP superfamily phosphohydrolase